MATKKANLKKMIKAAKAAMDAATTPEAKAQAKAEWLAAQSELSWILGAGK